MTSKIKTRLPDPNTFTDSLNYHCSGKWFIGIALLIGIGALAMGNSLTEMSQWNTLYLFLFFCIYLLIPARFYMKGYYWFFINSWLIGFATVALFVYTTTLNLHRLAIHIKQFDLYIYTIIFIIFIVDFFEKRKKLATYRGIISKSINHRVFYIENWLKDLEESEVYQGMGFALWVSVAVGAVVILVGTIFGGGLMTAKVLLSNGFDIIVEIVVGLSMFVFSMIVLSRFTHETLKLISAYQVKKELTKKN